MTGVRRTCEDTHTGTQREERRVTVETEIEVMQPQAKDCWPPPEDRRRQGGLLI